MGVLPLLLVLLALGCSGDRRPGRVLVVGLDGATLRVVEPLLSQGRLPNLGRIAAEGVRGPLQSFPPLASPRIWTTIATGKVPEKHGILSFVHRREDGSTALYLGSDRKTHALWNITSDAGLATGVVNWWTTFPPERIRGVMISDHLLEDELAARRYLFGAAETHAGPTAWPTPWIGKALELARAPDAPPEPPDPLSVAVLPRSLVPEKLSAIAASDRAATRIALVVEEELRPDVLLVFMSGIDRVSHTLWGAFESTDRFAERTGLTPLQAAAARDALLDYYEYADRLVGLLLERFGEHDLVMVVSDHGFEEAPHRVGPLDLTGQHETDAASRGIVFARGTGLRRGVPVEGTTVNDVTPTILAWLGVPLGADMDGKPAAFLERRAPPPIPTHDTRPVDRVLTDSRGAEDEVIEQLRGLGYLE